jgi:hypothetical protein
MTEANRIMAQAVRHYAHMYFQSVILIDRLKGVYAMKFNCLLLIALALVLATGCQTLHVQSYPPGAKILIDDVAQFERTPHHYFVRDLERGSHKVTVVMDGYKTVTPPQDFNIGQTTGDIILNIFPPIFLKNLFVDHWKNLTPKELKPFELVQDVSHAHMLRSEDKSNEDHGTVPARMKQLETLREQKLITEEEYRTKRQLLLDKL